MIQVTIYDAKVRSMVSVHPTKEFNVITTSTKGQQEIVPLVHAHLEEEGSALHHKSLLIELQSCMYIRIHLKNAHKHSNLINYDLKM